MFIMDIWFYLIKIWNMFMKEGLGFVVDYFGRVLWYIYWYGRL